MSEEEIITGKNAVYTVKELTTQQQAAFFIFDRWACIKDATDVYLAGVNANGEIVPLFKLQKVVDFPKEPMSL
jgi:hypothetical protein